MIYLGEIGWEVLEWMHFAHDRGKWPAVLNMLMNLPIP
jgi:hypothetical protein